jgi:hypothetical protein
MMRLRPATKRQREGQPMMHKDSRGTPRWIDSTRCHARAFSLARARKYTASFSTVSMRGLRTVPAPIFSMVLYGTPEPADTSRHFPLLPCNSAKMYAKSDSIAGETVPISGPWQAENILKRGQRTQPMEKDSKKIISRAAREARNIFGRFLKQRIIASCPGMSLSDAYEQVGRDSGGISSSTIERIVAGKVGPTLDTIANLSVRLGFTLFDVQRMQEQSKAKNPAPLVKLPPPNRPRPSA